MRHSPTAAFPASGCIAVKLMTAVLLVKNSFRRFYSVVDAIYFGKTSTIDEDLR